MHGNLLDSVEHVLKRSNSGKLEIIGEEHGSDDEKDADEDRSSDVHEGNTGVVPGEVVANCIAVVGVDVHVTRTIGCEDVGKSVVGLRVVVRVRICDVVSGD